MAIPASHHIRTAAFSFANKMKANEQLMADIGSAIAAIEEGKRSSLTVLQDLEVIFTPDDFKAFPKVGSEAPKVVRDTNTLYDWYENADKTKGRFYYDIADALDPDITQLKRAFQDLARSKSDTKTTLANTIDDKGAREFFLGFEWGTDEVERQAKKYARRYSSLRDMVLKAFAVEQIVSRLNSLPYVSCVIERNSDGKYHESPTPVMFSNDYAGRNPKDDPFKRKLWSVGTLMLLERPMKVEKDGKMVPIAFTLLDEAIEKGGTFDLIAKCVERDREDGTNASKSADIRSLKATSPEDFISVATVLSSYLYEVKDGSWQMVDKAESRLLNALKPANQEEAVILLCKLSEAFDSLATKLDSRYSQIGQTTKAA